MRVTTADENQVEAILCKLDLFSCVDRSCTHARDSRVGGSKNNMGAAHSTAAAAKLDPAAIVQSLNEGKPELLGGRTTTYDRFP